MKRSIVNITWRLCVGIVAAFTATAAPNKALGSAVDQNDSEVVIISPRKDNTLFNTGSDRSSGAGDAVFSGKTGLGGGGTVQRAVLAFDVAGNVPPGSTITFVPSK